MFSSGLPDRYGGCVLSLVLVSPLVTVSFAPLPLPKALERLSAAAGERLTCAKILNDETLLARLKDADETRIRVEIAAALDAKWEPTEGGWLLKPDPLAARRRALAEERQRAAAIQAGIAEVAKSVAEGATKYQAQLSKIHNAQPGTVVDDLEDVLPAARAAGRFVSVVGLRTLLSLRPEERIVYSDSPTPMQQDFPSGGARVLADYLREEVPGRRGVVVRFRLIVQQTDEDTFSFGFEALNAAGAIIDQAEVTVEPERDRPLASEFSSLPNERPLVVSTAAREYAALMNRQTGRRDATFARWRSILADPVAHEPTAWFPGEALVAAAQARGENLIGTLGDVALARMSHPASDLPTALLKSLSLSVSRRDGWIVAHNWDFFPAISRAEARALIARSLAANGLSIDDAADWSANHPGQFASLTWLGAHLNALLPNSIRTLGGDGIDFWARLTPQFRQALRRGETVPLGVLPDAAVRIVAEDVFWNEAVQSLEPTDSEPEAAKDAFFRTEITEKFRNGLPQGVLTLTVAEEPVVYGWIEAAGEPLSANVLTADRYGTAQALWERGGKDPGYDHFRMGVARNYTLRFDFGRGMFYTKSMTESRFEPSGAVLERLPDDFVKRAAEAKRKALEAPDSD